MNIRDQIEALCSSVIGAAIEVHKLLGPGLLESIYAEPQALTYLHLSEKQLGLLLNFNVQAMRQGIKRVVNGL